MSIQQEVIILKLIHSAIESNDVERLNRLFEQKKHIIVPILKKSGLGHPRGFQLISATIDRYKLDIANVLLSNIPHPVGVNFNYERNETLLTYYSSLTFTAHLNHDAEEHSRLLSIVKLLLQNNADTNQTDNDGKTPLMLAFENNDLELFELILKHGHNVDTSEIQRIHDTNPNDETKRELYDMLNKYNCRFCKSRTNHTKCGKCRVVRYCSKKCQTDDWENHKEECRKLCSDRERHRLTSVVNDVFGDDLTGIDSIRNSTVGGKRSKTTKSKKAKTTKSKKAKTTKSKKAKTKKQ